MWREDAEQVEREVIGRHLRDSREGARRSRLAVARASGVTRSRIAAIESGSARATEQELRAITNACGTDLATVVPPGYHLTLTRVRPNPTPWRRRRGARRPAASTSRW
jgi:transcriptional regulator with XRE-family HTH domain